jgi:hypothetical protein
MSDLQIMNLNNDVQNLLGKYFDWLKDKTLLKNISNEWAEITTPHLDQHNDCLQIYLKRDGTNFLLTDDGYIIDDLKTSGCDLTTHKRKEILTTILNSFGVHLDLDTNRLTIHASEQDFPLKKHNLIQAMLAVDDIFYPNRSQVKSLFVEDIAHWFDSTKVRNPSKQAVQETVFKWLDTD